ncbi:MAG: FHA domain-containing protein [Verrucomicrobiae bacterium]|nr:FHA domain-containing protein [Verrucomicrobiae bacterium]MCP5550160.1 FHA domain-containing protein [Akkermansiaceae bacterium]
MPKITIHIPGEQPQKYGLEDQIEVSVGRADDNDIIITHDSISGHHAQLKMAGDGFVLVDLDSTNGTFLDGAPVSEAPLHHGARVTFGQVEAEYEAEEEYAAGYEEAPAEDDGFGAASGGSGFESTIHAEIPDRSVLPAGFRNLSPFQKPEKKDVLAQIAVAAGIVAILAVAAAAGFAHMMKL